MQTRFSPEFLNTMIGQQIDAQLRACVHCGFCNATCPTYQLTANELDGPRGRIYLMQSMLEGEHTSKLTQLHVDRCLSCLSCETTCPSGVRYSIIKDYAQGQLEKRGLRTLYERILRWLLRNVLSSKRLFAPLWKLAQWGKPLLPKPLQPVSLTVLNTTNKPLQDTHERFDESVLLLKGCVQQIVAPHVNIQLKRLLHGCNMTCLHDQQEGCCGALHFHNGDHDKGKRIMRANIVRWDRLLKETGAQKIVIAASGCGQMIRQYAQIFAHDRELGEAAARISTALVDAGQLLQTEQLQRSDTNIDRVAFQAPCSLQHGMNNHQEISNILLQCGYQLVPVQDAHICCGSAGTYSILQAEMAGQLRENKLRNLSANNPDCIATANIGCQMHLQSDSNIPVLHWLELIEAKQ